MSLCYKFPAESNSERILKIGKYLVKLWARVRCLVFLTHSVDTGQSPTLTRPPAPPGAKLNCAVKEAHVYKQLVQGC